MHLNFKPLRLSGELMTQYTCESCANMDPMGKLMNPLPCHATSNCIKTQNTNPKNHNTNPKNECNYCQIFVSQENNRNMLHETYFHAC